MTYREMNRRGFVKTCLAGTAAVVSAGVGEVGRSLAESRSSTAFPGQPAFDLRGIYFHDGFHAHPKRLAPLYWGLPEWSRQVCWLHSCGINAIEFATMLEFNRIPETDLERKKIADRLRILDLAHKHDVQFGYILTNTVFSTVPQGEEPGDQFGNRAVQLCPRRPSNFEKTLALQQWYIDTYREADFFEEFAADWGACHCGQCDVEQYLRYVNELANHLHRPRHTVPLYANTWCISYWGPNPIPLGWHYVFDRETSGARKVIESLPHLPGNVHLTLPCHNLYRPLAFTSFGGKRNTPLFPQRDDLQPLVSSGRKVMAWPHFVMDDDPSRGQQWGLVHSEVRYLADLLHKLRDFGIRQVIGNLYLPTLQLINTYAFAQLTNDPDIAPQRVLENFAKLLAQPADAGRLCEVLCWLDNHSYWNEQQPSDARLPNLPCSLTRQTALQQVRQVRPTHSPDLPLPVEPSQWLDELARSISEMKWAA